MPGQQIWKSVARQLKSAADCMTDPPGFGMTYKIVNDDTLRVIEPACKYMHTMVTMAGVGATVR